MLIIKKYTETIKWIIKIALIGSIIIAGLFYLLVHSHDLVLVNGCSIPFRRMIRISLKAWIVTVILFGIFRERFQITCFSLTWITCFVLSFFISVLFLAGATTHGQAFQSILFGDVNDTFMDFFNSIQYGMTPYKYELTGIYPPLINIIYGLIGKYVSVKAVTMHAYDLRTSQMGSLIFMLFSVVQYGALIYVISSTKTGSKVTKSCFTLVMFLSLPFLYVMERANSVTLALLFVLLFVEHYQSENTHIRIGSYIALGVATGIKIAPFIFILLILRRREYRNTILAMVIGAVLFLFPFVFTDGNPFILAHNINRAVSFVHGSFLLPNGNLMMMGHGDYVNLSNLVNCIGRLLNFNVYIIGKYLNFLIFCFGCLIVLLKKNMEEWKAVTILSGLMVIFPGFSGVYNLIYMIVPFILYLNFYEENHRSADFCFVLFLLLFVPIINFNVGAFARFAEDIRPLRMTTVYESIAIVLLIATLIIKESFDSLGNFRRKNIMLTCCVLVLLAGYYLFYSIQPASVDAFYPTCYVGQKAQKGVLMHKGIYKYIEGAATFSLTGTMISRNGLTIIVANENSAPNGFEVLIHNQLIEESIIEKKSRETVYIDGQKLKNYVRDNKLCITIKNKMNYPLSLIYIGDSKLLEKIYPKIQ